jgi:hypothetical protein
MTAQTVEQGQFLGGRPPYRYPLVYAGPHPDRAQVVARLRADSKVVMCGRSNWTLAATE